ncbi:MAG TPA: glycogen/starch/alpha-glucan phosphorylase [candidate division Zixibacteria bacterium]|nr:glycogen/starch/alpha-glucan phosphorylase [candidate division Zixibacteria bacterium]
MSAINSVNPASPIEILREDLARHIRYTLVRQQENLTPVELLIPVSLAVRDQLVDRMLQTEQRYSLKDAKRLYYLSMEFLMGRIMGDTAVNLRITDLLAEVLREYGVSVDEVLEAEPDAGLGNGGLGRLAACFLESLATLGMPGYGYGIDYEYGLFRQEIVNGFQREKPDRWKANGTPFQIPRAEEAIVIPLYGRVEGPRDNNPNSRPHWRDFQIVVGIPNDMPIAGYNGDTVNFLRLFQARSSDDFDIEIFNRGDYIRAVEQKIGSENISRVLYPSDSAMQGKELRLVQEYFLVSCAVHDIVRRYLADHESFDEFANKVAIQMNDTHPALSVAELMRVLIDERSMEWEQAWDITRNTLAYTNHTLLPEALERWSVPLIERVLPRHTQIIYTINFQFLRSLQQYSWIDGEKVRRMSIIEEGHEKNVRMALLAIVGSHAINGVSELHSKLIQSSLVPEFARLWPEKFSNKTNGVAPRRWLLKANPPLSRLLNNTIGNAWICDLEELRKLEKFADDAAFQEKFAEVKHQNKLKLARILRDDLAVLADPSSMFDVQIKRIHEYKRQLLNVLRVIYDYLRVVEDGETLAVPRTVIFAGKAAPGYWAAKQIIKLIHNVADVVNHEPKLKNELKIAFLPDYRVSLAEAIIPAADLSEQISTAGMEASGTGNMKLMMNGAVTMATFDGANIEIYEEVGEENIYVFGLRAEEIEHMQREGSYNPRSYYEKDPRVKRVLDCFLNDHFSPHEPGLFRWIFDELINRGDRFFHIADLPQYIEINEQVDRDYVDKNHWRKMSILNTARSPKFSSDRTIKEYAHDIWNIEPCLPEHTLRSEAPEGERPPITVARLSSDGTPQEEMPAD